MNYKILFALLTLTFLLAQCKDDVSTERLFTIHQHPISRGAYQWILVNKNDSFLATNLADSLKVDNKAVRLTIKFTGKNEDLLQPGPVDIPLKFKELPLIEVQ